MINILLATRNREEAFAAAIKSLAAQSIAGDLGLVIMDGNEDNSYVQKSLDAVNNVFPHVKIFGDSVLPPEKLRWPAIYNFLAKNRFDKCSFLSYWSDDIQLSQHNMLERAEILCLTAFNTGAVAFPFINEDSPNRLMLQPIAGCHDQTYPMINYGLIRRETWDDVGGIDEFYQFYHADCAISHKIIRRGYKILGYPYLNSYVYHFSPSKVWKSPAREGELEDRLRYQKEFNLTGA